MGLAGRRGGGGGVGWEEGGTEQEEVRGRMKVEVYLQGGLPGLALHGLDAVQQLHKEVPAGGRDVALHSAQEAAEHVHLHIILVHACTGHQPPHGACITPLTKRGRCILYAPTGYDG